MVTVSSCSDLSAALSTAETPQKQAWSSGSSFGSDGASQPAADEAIDACAKALPIPYTRWAANARGPRGCHHRQKVAACRRAPEAPGCRQMRHIYRIEAFGRRRGPWGACRAGVTQLSGAPGATATRGRCGCPRPTAAPERAHAPPVRGLGTPGSAMRPRFYRAAAPAPPTSPAQGRARAPGRGGAQGQGV